MAVSVFAGVSVLVLPLDIFVIAVDDYEIKWINIIKQKTPISDVLLNWLFTSDKMCSWDIKS